MYRQKGLATCSTNLDSAIHIYLTSSDYIQISYTYLPLQTKDETFPVMKSLFSTDNMKMKRNQMVNIKKKKRWEVFRYLRDC